VLTRIWGRPTLEIHGIRGGYSGEGAKTVIPASASVKISLRLVPDQDPEEVAKQLQSAVEVVCPKGVSARVNLMSGSPPCLIDPENPFLLKAARAMEKVFGKRAAFIRCGGSIPIVSLIQQQLGIPSVLLGFGLPDDRIHAPNEKLLIANYERGIESLAQYYDLVGLGIPAI
jgi:acetylornithine deacetylase/succinyl-diaminopimelate desuccinylase-like protein